MKLHSEVDVITNSSTEIFIYPSSDAIKQTKNFLQKLVESINPEYKMEDYFSVVYKLEASYIRDEYEYGGSEQLNTIVNEYLSGNNISNEEFDMLSSEDQLLHFKKISEIVSEKYQNGEYSLDAENYDGEPIYSGLNALSVIIKLKNDKEIDLWRAMPFCVEAVENY